MKRKLAQYCGISYRLRNHFNYNTSRKFHYSCVYSTLSVWGGIWQCTSHCETIIELHKRTVTNLFAKYFLEYSDNFQLVKVLKFVDAYKLKVAINLFRMTKSGELPSLQHNLNPMYPSHMWYGMWKLQTLLTKVQTCCNKLYSHSVGTTYLLHRQKIFYNKASKSNHI